MFTEDELTVILTALTFWDGWGGDGTVSRDVHDIRVELAERIRDFLTVQREGGR